MRNPELDGCRRGTTRTAGAELCEDEVSAELARGVEGVGGEAGRQVLAQVVRQLGQSRDVCARVLGVCRAVKNASIVKRRDTFEMKMRPTFSECL